MRSAAHKISADFASECLKLVSDDVGRELMQKVVQTFVMEILRAMGKTLPEGWKAFDETWLSWKRLA